MGPVLESPVSQSENGTLAAAGTSLSRFVFALSNTCLITFFNAANNESNASNNGGTNNEANQANGSNNGVTNNQANQANGSGNNQVNGAGNNQSQNQGPAPAPAPTGSSVNGNPF